MKLRLHSALVEEIEPKATERGKRNVEEHHSEPHQDHEINRKVRIICFGKGNERNEQRAGKREHYQDCGKNQYRNPGPALLIKETDARREPPGAEAANNCCLNKQNSAYVYRDIGRRT